MWTPNQVPRKLILSLNLDNISYPTLQLCDPLPTQAEQTEERPSPPPL